MNDKLYYSKFFFFMCYFLKPNTYCNSKNKYNNLIWRITFSIPPSFISINERSIESIKRHMYSLLTVPLFTEGYEPCLTVHPHHSWPGQRITKTQGFRLFRMQTTRRISLFVYNTLWWGEGGGGEGGASRWNENRQRRRDASRDMR